MGLIAATGAAVLLSGCGRDHKVAALEARTAELEREVSALREMGRHMRVAESNILEGIKITDHLADEDHSNIMRLEADAMEQGMDIYKLQERVRVMEVQKGRK